MYLYYFVHLDGEPAECARRLDGNRDRLRILASSSLSDIDFIPTSPDRLEMGALRSGDSRFTLPIRWEAPGLFFDVAGELILQPVSPGITQLALRASYRPNAETDSRDTHLLVEAAVKGLLDALSQG